MTAGSLVCVTGLDSSEMRSHSVCHINLYRVSAKCQKRTARVQCACSGLFQRVISFIYRVSKE